MHLSLFKTSIVSVLANRQFYIGIGVIIVLALVIYLINDYLRVPFGYPIVMHTIDLSGRRRPSYDDCIDEWLIHFDGHSQAIIDEYEKTLKEWEGTWEDYINRSWFWKKHKRKTYNSIRDVVTASNYEMFKFRFTRDQTRYKQVYYQKYAYKTRRQEHVIMLTLCEILEIYDELEEIDYETTREKYFAKNQRRLMTKELRRRIIERDNYTCQICGKFMPDEVGLHVDHIIPINKGGKSIESNLQVLCDKCNLRKGRQ